MHGLTSLLLYSAMTVERSSVRTTFFSVHSCCGGPFRDISFLFGQFESLSHGILSMLPFMTVVGRSSNVRLTALIFQEWFVSVICVAVVTRPFQRSI